MSRAAEPSPICELFPAVITPFAGSKTAFRPASPSMVPPQGQGAAGAGEIRRHDLLAMTALKRKSAIPAGRDRLGTGPILPIEIPTVENDCFSVFLRPKARPTQFNSQDGLISDDLPSLWHPA